MTHTMETNAENKYLANDITPVYPVHPGGILGEELKARGISQKKFAEEVGLQATHLSALIHGTRNFTEAVATKIAAGLEGIPAEMWIKLQERYNADVLRKKVNTSRLVSGYDSTQMLQPAFLADPDVPCEGYIQVTLRIPVSDKPLLDLLVNRFGWKYC